MQEFIEITVMDSEMESARVTPTTGTAGVGTFVIQVTGNLVIFTSSLQARERIAVSAEEDWDDGRKISATAAVAVARTDRLDICRISDRLLRLRVQWESART